MRHEDENDTPLSDEERELAKRGEALISAAVAETRAPQSLREAIEGERERARAAPRESFWRRHPRILAASATLTAGLAAAIVLVQGGGESAAPSLAAVESAAQLRATRPPPRPSGGEPPVLAARVAPISFPDWRKSFGWRAVGRREDEISGRTVRTVFYRNPEGARLAYSIVAGEPLAEHPPGRQVTHEGKSYHVAHAGAHTLVTWTQQGHTCSLVASATVPESRLVELAASRNT